MTGTRKEALEVVLDRVPCIHHPVQFRKDKEEATIQALINSGSEGNVMTPAYAKKLGFWTQRTDIGA